MQGIVRVLVGLLTGLCQVDASAVQPRLALIQVEAALYDTVDVAQSRTVEEIRLALVGDTGFYL